MTSTAGTVSTEIPKLKPIHTTSIPISIPLFIVGGFLIFISILYWLTPIGKNEKFNGFISLVGSVGIITALISFALGYLSEANQRSQTQVSTFSSLVDNYISGLEKEFTNNKNLNRLYKQTHSSDPGVQALKDPPEITPEVLGDELHMANQILQAAENIGIQIYNLNPTGWAAAYFQGIFNRFKDYFKSDIVQKRYFDTRSYWSPQMQFATEKIILPSVHTL